MLVPLFRAIEASDIFARLAKLRGVHSHEVMAAFLTYTEGARLKGDAQFADAVAALGASHVTALVNHPDALPVRRASQKRAGGLVKRKATAEGASCAAVFLAHATARHLEWLQGGEGPGEPFVLFRKNLLVRFYPLSAEGQEALASCDRLYEAAEGDRSRVPAVHWTGLMTARENGDRVDPDLYESHFARAGEYFIFQALHHTLDMLVGRSAYQKLRPEMGHTDSGRFDLELVIPLAQDWYSRLEDTGKIVRSWASTRANTEAVADAQRAYQARVRESKGLEGQGGDDTRDVSPPSLER